MLNSRPPVKEKTNDYCKRLGEEFDKMMLLSQPTSPPTQK
jgi:hypothetical protein